ncbi:MAG: SDR family oxidoreductase, partial [Mesorhizobium sp.]
FQTAGLTTKPNEAMDAFSSMITLKRPSTPADIVGVAKFLASAGADYMTGQTVIIDGGMIMD